MNEIYNLEIKNAENVWMLINCSFMPVTINSKYEKE